VRQETAIVSKSEHLLASQVPFGAVPINSEVVLKGPSMSTILVMSQESLRTEKASREIFVDEYLIYKWDNVTGDIKSFPSGSADEFDLKAA